jgi:hypothetical protein
MGIAALSQTEEGEDDSAPAHTQIPSLGALEPKVPSRSSMILLTRVMNDIVTEPLGSFAS